MSSPVGNGLRRDCRGVSSLEVVIAASILGPMMLFALSASQNSMTTARVSASASEEQVRSERASESMGSLLLGAAQDTIQAVPAGEQSVPETLMEDLVYDNLQFRRASGWSEGVRAYDPPLGSGPIRVELAFGGYHQGERTTNLVQIDGDRSTVLASDVTDLRITRSGNRYTIRWTEATHSEPRSIVHTYLVRTR